MGVEGGVGKSRMTEDCRNKVERCTVTREVVEYFFILCPRKQRHTSHRCSTCMTPRRRCFTRASSVVNGL